MSLPGRDVPTFSQATTLSHVITSGSPVIVPAVSLTASQTNAVSAFSPMQTNINNSTPYYVLGASSTGGGTGTSGGGGTGPTGPAGTNGTPGGPTGDTGPAGTNGTPGGPTGPTGAAGANGTPGGPTGATGPAGSGGGGSFTGPYVQSITFPSTQFSVGTSPGNTGGTQYNVSLNAQAPLSLNQTTPPTCQFGVNVAPASAVTILDGVFFPSTLNILPPGTFFICIPLTIQVAQNPVGTPVASGVTPGTCISHVLVVGDIDAQITTPLQSFPLVANGSTNALYASSIPTVLCGVFVNPAATVSSVFRLRAYSAVPQGGIGDNGYWGYSIPGTDAINPKAFLQQIA